MRFLSAAVMAGLMLAAIPTSASAVTLPAPPAVGESQSLVEKAYGSRFYFSYGVPRYRSYYYSPYYSYYYRPSYAYSYVPRVYYPRYRYYYPRYSYGIRFGW